MDEKAREFLEQNPTAAMITLRPDGAPHAVRVAVGLLDGRLLSSGTQDRLRTRFLRRDPRATLFVFDANPSASWRWLTLETRVSLIEGPEVPSLSLRFFRKLQRRPEDSATVLWSGQERTVDDFLRLMVEEKRLLYEFQVERAYGMH